MRRSSRFALGLSAVILAACGGADDGSGGSGAQPATAEVGGDVVSVVERHAITRAEVEALAREAELTPTLALQRLQEERLLFAAAERAGLAIGEPESARAVRQAAVQRLLREEVEDTVGVEAVDEARVASRFETELARFERPERRTSTHLVALLPEDAPPPMVESGRLYIEAQIARAAERPDAESALLAVTRQLDDGTPFELQAEELPALNARSGADAAYLRALFEAEGEGLIPVPVRTSFGWHAIVVSEIEPEVEVSREDALAELRAEELARLRATRLEALVRELAAQASIDVDRERVQATFADPRFMAEP